jgi:hypothetical protein
VILQEGLSDAMEMMILGICVCGHEEQRLRSGKDVTRVEEDFWMKSFIAIHCDQISCEKLS